MSFIAYRAIRESGPFEGRFFAFKPFTFNSLIWPISIEIRIRGNRGRVFSRLISSFALWCQRGKERRNLRKLNDRLLRDIGRSRAEATREGDRPFWEGDER
ncbi:DUF1127 domain-containing protein [Terasakiella sp.]|uniref:DUF1127 domain-containing protein n=1 Tax=Terasakiella sp. TaxID=2034861 RepID=UPI003AA92129